MKSVFIIAIVAVVMIGVIVPSVFAYTISDDSTGGDCSMIGTWNSPSKTCILTMDIFEEIMLESDGVTLDGNNHSIISESIGISSNGKNNLTIENLTIKAFVWGTNIKNTDNTVIQNNHLIGTSSSPPLFGQHGIAVGGSNILIRNNLIENFNRISIMTDNARVEGNTIISYPLGAGTAMYIGGNSELVNNIADSKFEIYGKNNKIHDNTFSRIYTINNGQNSAISWHNNFLDFNIQENSYSLSYVLGNPASMGISTVGGNYYAQYDEISEYCHDENFDNLCDSSIKGINWNIPDGWLTTINSNGDIEKEAESSSGSIINFLISADYDGKKIGITCNPSSGSMFLIGETQVVCSTNNGRTSSFMITVQDTTPPSITVPPNIEIDTIDAHGAPVNFDEVMVSDNVQVSESSCNMYSGNLFPIGDNIVNCTATDIFNNTSTESFTISVVSDVPPPVMDTPEYIALQANSKKGAYVTFPTITATDPLGILEQTSCNPKSNSFFNIGTTIVECKAKNMQEYVGTQTFSVTVEPPHNFTRELLPSRDHIGTEWKFPTNKQVYNELNDRNLLPEDYSGFAEFTWYGYMKGGGYDSNFLDLYIYRFDTKNNADVFYSDHVNYWSDRGGYNEWKPSWNAVSADECYGRATSGMYTDKISLYCVKDNIVTFVTTTGYEYEMKDKLSNFADGVFDNMSKVNISQSKTVSNPMCGEGTIFDNGQCVIENNEEGGGCLIATATYGSEMSTEVQQLRELRDNQLLQTASGTAFMGTFNDIYYTFSPIVADYERENPLFKEVVKLAITPMISSLSLMENVNSESEVISLGLSVIALNLGMYLGVPAVLIIGIRKKF